MVSTKWFQGLNNLDNFLEIRKKVFCEELNMDEKYVTDFYDEFAFNLVLYDDDKPAGTGTLLFKDGKYFIDKLCVLNEYRGNAYGNLIIRMLVRKAVTIGSEKTYAEINKINKPLFEKIGFVEISSGENDNVLMMKNGDVGGHCCN